MTALAWDGKVLAADTQYDQGGHRGHSSKLSVINHPIIGKMMVALCGSVRGSSLMIDQLESNTVAKVNDYDVTCVYGIGVDSGKNVYNIYGDGYCVIEDRRNRFMASGSCYEFLYGAMFAGLSAGEAIELAIEHRTDAGNICETLVWSEVFKGYENERYHEDPPY
jgi:hypothetical protein